MCIRDRGRSGRSPRTMESMAAPEPNHLAAEDISSVDAQDLAGGPAGVRTEKVRDRFGHLGRTTRTTHRDLSHTVVVHGRVLLNPRLPEIGLGDEARRDAVDGDAVSCQPASHPPPVSYTH